MFFKSCAGVIVHSRVYLSASSMSLHTVNITVRILFDHHVHNLKKIQRKLSEYLCSKLCISQEKIYFHISKLRCRTVFHKIGLKYNENTLFKISL